MLGKWIKRAFWAGVLGFFLTAAFVVASYFYLKADIPNLDSVENYNPPRVTRIYSEDGQLVGELFRERRTVVPITKIPKHVIHAFLAAEDANFYEHEGIDWLGLLRAAVKNLRPGAHLQGASTITQQTVKTLVVGAERSYSRKMREAILTREIEQLLSKDEILYLYLNQIYFGSGAYGIEEAARVYFGKAVSDVTIGEAALLASIPKNPSHYTPAADPVAAKQRQTYVLEQMLAHGWIGEAEKKQALSQPVPTPPPAPAYLGAGPHYIELVKKMLVDKYGEETVMLDGLTVSIGMNARMQAAAHQAVRAGLENFTRTQGYAGPRVRIAASDLPRVKKALHESFTARLEKLAATAERKPTATNTIWDLSGVSTDDVPKDEALAQGVRAVPLEPYRRVTGLVSQADNKEIWIDLGSLRARLDWKTLQWAKKPGTSAPPKNPSDVLLPGDLVNVEVVDVPPANLMHKQTVRVEIVPEPKVQGALVAIDPHSRLVRAIVGGYKNDAGGFNRATQAHRQPGSSFKPLLYATGIDNGVITPASLCSDSPVVIRDEYTGKPWKPENYEDGRYDGNITYRTALVRSKNTCSVKLIEKLGFQKVIDFAKRAGIESKMPESLTLALGTGDVTPLELANSYSTIASGGLYAAPIFISKVTARGGKVLEETVAQPVEAIRPAVAYVVSSMMRSVVEEGTATKALVLDRPLAGKTGTSQESRNVWFSGFSAELVATVWVGYDDNAPLGRTTGGTTALPIWIAFMGRALSGVPVREFTPPADVVFVHVDPDSGEPTDDSVGFIEEAFLAGTEPSKATQALPSIFLEDQDGGPN